MSLGRKKPPCVDIKTDVTKDERFEALGDVAGYNRHEALGRMVALWGWCVDRGLKDAPDDCDGYAVSEPVIRRFLGDRGVEAILADGCDELALGVRRADGRIYLRGTSEYVEARRRRQSSAEAGGRARANAARSDAGRFVGEPTVVQPEHQPVTSRKPAVATVTEERSIGNACTIGAAESASALTIVQPTRQPVTSDSPAGEPAGDQPRPAPSPSPSSSPSGSLSLHALARARDIPPVPSTEYDAASPQHVHAWADWTWRAISCARVEIAAELGLTQVLPLPQRQGTPVEPRGFRDLRDRIREEGALAPAVCVRVVEALIAGARGGNGVEWLSEKAFTEGGWRHAREAVPGWRKPPHAAASEQRIGPASAVGHFDPSGLSPDDYLKGLP